MFESPAPLVFDLIQPGSLLVMVLLLMTGFFMAGYHGMEFFDKAIK